MKFIPQKDQMDCGPACLAMISSFYNKKYSLQYLRDNSFITREGVSLLGITEAANKIGFETISVKVTVEKIKDMPLPCILHWNQNHFVVLRKIKKNVFTGKQTFVIADPGHGFITLSENKFKKFWLSVKDNGLGFDTKFKNKGIGQKNMLSRAKSLNGKVEFISSLGNGTKVIMKIPL